MEDKCPICKGLKHITLPVDGRVKVVQCECLIRDKARSLLRSFDLTSKVADSLKISKGKFVYPNSTEFKLASMIYQKFRLGMPLKHCVVLDLSRGVDKVVDFLSFMVLLNSGKDFSILDLQDYSDSIFKNEKVLLSPITVVKSTLTLQKSLRAKLINELYLKSRMTSKIIIWLFDDFKAAKEDMPEIINIFSTVVVLPDYR